MSHSQENGVLPAVRQMLDVSNRPQAERYAEDPQVRSLVAAARERFGDAVEAVVLYGSFTRGQKDTLLDLSGGEEMSGLIMARRRQEQQQQQ